MEGMRHKVVAVSAGLYIWAEICGAAMPAKPSGSQPVTALARLQAEAGPVEAIFDQTGQAPIFLSGRLSKSNGSALATATDFLNRYSDLLKIVSPEAEFIPRSPENDPQGRTHIRFDQSYKGLPVWGKQLIAHLDEKGGLYNISGRWVPTPEVSTTPSISEGDAIQIASNDFSNGLPANLNAQAELMIFAGTPKPSLAYRVGLKGFTPETPVNYIYFIDAATGQILSQYDNLQTDGPAISVGVDLRQETRELATLKEGGIYKMVDLSRPNFAGIVTKDGNESFDQSLATYFVSSDSLFDAARDSAGVSAHFFMGAVYDYFLREHNRNSWDNQGTTVPVYVHVGTNYSNAFWDGASVNFGDGSGANYKDFSKTFDIVAHEFTHGVTQTTAGLVFQFQPGALNESYSDIFAVLADTTGTLDTARWLIGEDIVVNASAPYKYMRNVRDPHKGFPYNRFLFGAQPANMNEYQNLPLMNDNGGIHVNSGIPNRAFSLVANAIGFAKTGKIYYRTLAYYLSPGSQFMDAALLTMQSTIDLYGYGPEFFAVRTAFNSVGISINNNSSLAVLSPQFDHFAVPPGSFRDTTLTFINNSMLPAKIDSIRWQDPHLILPESDSFSVPSQSTASRTLRFSAADIPPTMPKVVVDTLKVFYTSPEKQNLSIPIRFYAFDSLSTLTYTQASTACQKLGFSNAGAFANGNLSSGLFRTNIGNFLFDGSLALGRIENGRKLVYRDLLSTQNFLALTTRQMVNLGGLATRYQSKFITEDGRLGLTQRMVFPNLNGHCDYVLCQYEVYPIAVEAIADLLIAVVCDFDVPGAMGNTNQAVVDSSHGLISITGLAASGTPDSNLAGIAFLNSDASQPFGAVAADNVIHTYPTGDWADSALYNLLNTSGFSDPAGAETDYTALMTLKKSTLIPGETLKVNFALITSENGRAPLLAAADSAKNLLARATTLGCPYLLGDLNDDFMLTAADVIAALNLVFLGIPPPSGVPNSRGDMDCDTLLDAADVVRLINSAFLNSPPASCSCPR